jgi:UTP--glucose-1-phosphate uridylyltransferase
MAAPASSLIPIDCALIPAAGFGTRLRPLTRAIPKEMLPLGRKPLLEYIVEELRAAGISRLLFVISSGKEMIRSYFGDGEKWGLRCDYTLQPEMRGLGDAVLQGEAWADGQPFIVAFGDCLIESQAAPDAIPVARLIATHLRERADATVLTERIPREKTRNYGILAPAVPLPDEPRDPFPMADIVEKPAPEDAPGSMAVAARWALNAGIFPCIRRAAPEASGEINLTDPVRLLLAAGGAGWGVPLLPGEARRDIGGWENYLLAAARAAAADPEFGPRVRAALRRT